jgi:hypothetical protein
MLWTLGTATTNSGENSAMPLDSTAPLWTTVDNGGMTISAPTSQDAASSPIHNPYYNNTKIS